MIHSITTNSQKDYEKDRLKDFCKTLSQIMNEYVTPTYGREWKFSVQMGLWTSDNYGSYKIPICDKEDKMLCYIIADTIMGEWKVYKEND